MAPSYNLPLLSVVVFVRNAVETLDRALASVTSNDQPAVELLVLDGGSTDGTVGVIRRYERHLAFWRSHKDESATDAINEGVRQASGDVICLLPADDWFEQGALRWVEDEFAGNPELDVLSCGTRIVHFDQDGDMHVDATFLSPEILEFKMSNIVRYPLTAARFIRRRVYERFGGHDLHYRMSNDFDFLARVCMARLKSRVLPRLVYTYCRHEGSSTLSGRPEMVMIMMAENMRISAYHLQDPQIDSEARRALLGMHGRSSARLAWMVARQGKLIEAFQILVRAMKLDWRWPIMVWFWLARGIIE